MFSVEISENKLLPVTINRNDIEPGAYTVTTKTNKPSITRDSSVTIYSNNLLESQTFLLLVGWNGSMLGVDLNDPEKTLRDFKTDDNIKYNQMFYNVKPVKSVRFVVEL